MKNYVMIIRNIQVTYLNVHVGWDCLILTYDLFLLKTKIFHIEKNKVSKQCNFLIDLINNQYNLRLTYQYLHIYVRVCSMMYDVCTKDLNVSYCT